MKILVKYSAKSFIDWLFRKKLLFLITFKISGAILFAMIGFDRLSGVIINYQGITFEIAQQDSLASLFFNALFGITLLVFIVSFVLVIFEFFQNKKLQSGKKVFVVEGRGLRDDDGTSLAESIGDDFPKSRIPYVLDLRQHLDGKLVSPEALIPKVSVAKEALNQTRRGNGRENTQVAYGGLTAVPLTFLTGIEFDDEGSISVFDWDRSSENWRPLDELDDGLRLSVPDLEEASLSQNVILAISISYPIEQCDLDSSFNYPVIRMDLEGRSSSSHWSAVKQSAIADQFFEIGKKLSECGVKHIHLVLAAPNSVVFNFGRRYDKRNLPELAVYQYERSKENKYPWGVQMPVGGTTSGYIVRTDPTFIKH